MSAARLLRESLTTKGPYRDLRVWALEAIEQLTAERDALLQKLNTPQVEDFVEAVKLEAAHQIERWDVDHDIGKEPMDWFWLVGYLAGKCLAAHISGDKQKALHHTISTAAALANWHSQIKNNGGRMQPGHAPSIVLAEKK